jgi:short-subunit dehydrogenase
MLRSQKVNTVLIAGASSGVGKKLAYLNAGIAGRLYLIDKSDEPLRALKGEIEAMSACQVSIAAIDMRDTRSIKTYADSIQGVDLFINIPGQPEKGAVSDTPLDVYKRDLDVNFFGVLYLLAELFKKESKPKKVIIVLPPVVIAGQRYHSSFTCAMSAFWAMTRSLRRVYGNELQVTEVISPMDSPVAYPLAADGADVSHVKGPLMADALAQNIYKAELKGREVVVTPVTARLLLVEEALTTGLFNKVHT